MALRNEFLQGRVAKADFTILASAATQSLPSGVFLPGGALVTGVTFLNTGAQTIADASGSVDLRVANTALSSSIALISTVRISDLGAQTVPYVASLVSAVGMYVAVPGELVLSVQATSGTAVHTKAPSVFVGYIAPV
jgi:hypothetical protein